MAEPFDLETRRSIRMAMAQDSYVHDRVRLIDPDLAAYQWLVATHKGLFAVNLSGAKLVAQGWFFGICRRDDQIFLFENCALRDRSRANGRLLRLQLSDSILSNPTILAKDLDANCHQVRVIDDLICLVDTANQAILRFTLDGKAFDTKHPFSAAPVSDRSGAYLHINAIAKVGNEIAIMLHNGKALPQKCSELAWLDSEWMLVRRVPLVGHCCHDIVEDETGAIWHSASMSGEIMASDGRRVMVDARRMTRGMAFSHDALIVGVSGFGRRENRDAIPGAVVIFNRDMDRLAEIELGGPPTDIIAI